MSKQTCGECDLYNVDFGFCAWDMGSRTENTICDNGEFVQTEEDRSKKLAHTCKDCLDFPGSGFYCRVTGRHCQNENDDVCDAFIVKHKPTIGDRLRKMCDVELARQFIRKHEERGELTTYSAEIPFCKWRTGSWDEDKVLSATVEKLKEVEK